MCLNIGTPKNINFPFGTNGKFKVLGVPILKHLRVAHNPNMIQLDQIICLNFAHINFVTNIFWHFKD